MFLLSTHLKLSQFILFWQQLCCTAWHCAVFEGLPFVRFSKDCHHHQSNAIAVKPLSLKTVNPNKISTKYVLSTNITDNNRLHQSVSITQRLNFFLSITPTQ